MHSKGILSSLQSIEINMCEDYKLGNHKRVSFHTSFKTLKKLILELVHSDVYKPMIVSSIYGKHYFVTFIENHSKNVWVYFLKHKSKLFKAFRIGKAMVENDIGLKIKKLKINNDGEYEDTIFKTFFDKHGIKMERTVLSIPYHM